MPTDNDHDDDLDPTGDDGSGGDSIVRMSRKDIRALERKGSKYDELAEQKAALERDLAFARAGIDTSTDEGAFFARGYAGELDVEAIKAQAAKFGVIKGADAPGTPPADGTTGEGTPPPSGPALEPGEADLTAHRQTLASGATGDSGLDVDPYQSALDIGRQVMEGGGKFEQALGSAINALANAANQGDKRVIIPGRSVQSLGGA